MCSVQQSTMMVQAPQSFQTWAAAALRRPRQELLQVLSGTDTQLYCTYTGDALSLVLIVVCLSVCLSQHYKVRTAVTANIKTQTHDTWVCTVCVWICRGCKIACVLNLDDKHRSLTRGATSNSDYCPSSRWYACQSPWNSSAPTDWAFVQFDVRVFFETHTDEEGCKLIVWTQLNVWATVS